MNPMPMLSTAQLIVVGLFALVFILMGVRPFNVVRVPMQMGGRGGKRIGLHWVFNLIALLFWGAAWYAYPSRLVLSGRVERSTWMMGLALILLLAGVIVVGMGLSRNWKKGAVE